MFLINRNKNKKYLDCELLRNSIHFFYDYIGVCCTNVYGPAFYKNYKGGKINWNYIYNTRKKYIKKINSVFTKEGYPKCCKGCFVMDNSMKDSPIDENFANEIRKVYFHHNQSCNAKCIYCTYQTVEKGCRYKVVPIIKSMIENKILSKYANIYMSGGEITISPEFDELLFLLLDYIENIVEIFSSCIKYSKSIEQAFVQNKCRMFVSLDSSCRETYLKLKQVDCFDKVVDNLKNYIKASDNAKENIILKYIIVDDVNDNETELVNFIHLVKDIGVKNIRMDFDLEKYKYERDKKIPRKYYDLYKIFDKEAEKEGLTILRYEQVEGILDKFAKDYGIEYVHEKALD